MTTEPACGGWPLGSARHHGTYIASIQEGCLGDDVLHLKDGVVVESGRLQPEQSGDKAKSRKQQAKRFNRSSRPFCLRRQAPNSQRITPDPVMEDSDPHTYNVNLNEGTRSQG